MHVTSPLALIVAAGLLGLLAQPSLAASAQPAAAGSTTIVRSANPARENLSRMQKVISVDFDGTRLEDALKSIADQTGVEFEPLWKNERGDGLDPEAQVKLTEKNLPALTVLTKILLKVMPDDKDDSTWQFSSEGRMQLGRKADLNKFKRVEVYSIRDLLLPLPIFPEVPEVNLQQALQAGGKGGGGGGSPFTSPGGNRQKDPKTIEEERRTRAQEIITLITQYAEANQWVSGSGDIANPRYFDGNIIVDAPDYIHRALVGYSWWPSSKTTTSAGARRYATLSMDSAIATVSNFRTLPVSAGVPGGGG